MHYYQFNIGDYRKDTTHLTPLEHYIYRSLIDWYYMDEQPIPRKTQVVMRRLGLGSDLDKTGLENVLSDFFLDTKEGWKHPRIEEELEKYKSKASQARANGKKGGRPKKQEVTSESPEEEKPRKTQPVIYRNPEITGSKANHKPITNNQSKKNKQKKTLVSEDWRPTDKTADWFAKQGFDFSIADMTEQYVNGCRAKGREYVDHDSAFRNWSKKHDEYTRARKQQGSRPNAAQTAFDTYKQYAEADQSAVDSNTVCETSGPVRAQVVKLAPDR